MFQLPVTHDDIVLEIGSGHNPHPRSDLLVDRWLYKDRERQRKHIQSDRPLIIADGCKLPFTDNTFDFVLCNQVLEHVADPVRFTAEISRVSKRGLIVVPHVLRERLFGWHYHRWFVDIVDDTLIIHPKAEDEQSNHAHFIHTLYAHSIHFRNYINQNERKLNIYYFWNRAVKIKVKSKDKQYVMSADNEVGKFLATATYDKNIPKLWFEAELEKVISMCQRYKTKIARSSIRDAMWRSQAPKLVCISCRTGVLTSSKDKLTCKKCGASFPMIDNVPVILDKQSINEGY